MRILDFTFSTLHTIANGLAIVLLFCALLALESPVLGPLDLLASCCFFLLSCSFLANFPKNRRIFLLGDALAIAVQFLIFPDLLGFLYQGSTHSSSLPMPLVSALAFFTISLSIPLSRIKHGLFSRLLSQGMGGGILRKALPLIVLVPILLGWLCLKGRDYLLFDITASMGFLVLANIALLSGFAWYAAKRLDLLNERLSKKEEAMAESEKKFRRIFYSNMMGITFWNAQGVIAEANDAFLKMLGFDQDDLKSGTIKWKDLTPPEYSEFDGDANRQIRETGTCKPYVKEYIKKDGSRMPVLLGAAALADDRSQGVSFVIDHSEKHQANLALKQSEQKSRELALQLQTVLDRAPIALNLFDRNGTYTFSEGKILADMGLKSGELVGQSIYERHKHYPQMIEQLKRALQGETINGELKIRNSWFLCSSTPILDESGEVSSVISLAFDITERKKVEEIMKQNDLAQKKIQMLVENSSDFIAIADLNQKIEFVNAAGLKMVGLKDFKGVDVSQYFTEESFQRIIKEIVPTIMKVGNWEGEIEFRNMADNRTIPAIMNAFTIKDSKTDQPIALATVSRDITERKEAEKQILSRDKKLQTILDNAPMVLSFIDSLGIIRHSEGKGLERLGRKSGDSVGTSIYDIYQQIPLLGNLFIQAIGGEPGSAEYQISNEFFESYMVPEFSPSGEIVGVNVLSMDISERKKAEHDKALLLVREQTALETSKLKSEFLANMSHEIRTPINGVLGMASLLIDTTLDQEQKEYIDSIKSSGDTLLTIINDILDFSKIEAGKLEFEEINFNLPDLIADTIKAFSFTVKSKGIGIQSTLASDVKLWVKGDPGRFRQVLNNLISNAIKFTKTGQVSIRVQNQGNEQGIASIRVEVEDTGIGISKEGLERMFKAFSQADSSTSRKFGGTGLGLSISKHLVEKMGGTIGVESIEGQGSTFWFTVRFRPGQESAKDSTQTSNLLFSTTQTARILVAEDNRINQIITLKYLEKMGCKAFAVTNGHEVIKALKEAEYDLILMDCQMPEMDGYEATRIIRESELTEAFSIPIIAMTANAMKGDEEKCLAAGMDDYVSKPISAGHLAIKISQWLERSQLKKSKIKTA